MTDHKTFPKPTKIKKVFKKISPIGKRTKRRLAEYGSETDLHNAVWDTQPHLCEVCFKYIQERSPVCFAHRLSKGMYPEYRYLANNIGLVCSIDCHHKFDTKYQGNEEYQIFNRNSLKYIFNKELAESRVKLLKGLSTNSIWIDEAIN